ncbi:MAG: 50S ribosomal protein L22 [Treponema sp.]|nr:50S ribosomal protein L22 [Treponema sp.]
MATKKENTGYRAVTRYLIVSPYKIRPVADLVRRKPYTEALSLLENMPHKGAHLIKKTLVSAGSNALSRDKKLAEDMLYVKEVLIDEGPRMKRIWIRGRGRADMLLKRMSHITVVVDETVNAGAVSKPRKSSSTKADK